MLQPKIVSREEWIEARKRLLAKEKAFTRLRDQLSEERRGLPWVRIEKPYRFEGPNGALSLADLFEGRSQSSSITSCLAPTGKRAASRARSGPTISTASPSISIIGA